MELRREPKFEAVSTVPQIVAVSPLVLGKLCLFCLHLSLPPGTQSSSLHQGVVCRQSTSNLAYVPSEGPRLPICRVCARACVYTHSYTEMKPSPGYFFPQGIFK